MRVRGDKAPANAFTLEEQPKNPGYVLVRFYENVEPFEETTDDLTMSGFIYDEYRLEMQYTDSLSDEILNNYNTYMLEAKLRESEEDTIPTLNERIVYLEEEKADKAEVQAVWDQMADAYGQGVSEA